MKAKIIWISTAPRTGSMWTSNVVREILSRVGKTVKPHKQDPYFDSNVQSYVDIALADGDKRAVYVYKTHERINAEAPQSRIVTIVRDPREMIFSYINFTGSNFDVATRMGESAVKFHEYYIENKNDNILLLRYEDVLNKQKRAIKRISDFFNYKLTKTVVENIADKYTKRNVATIISEAEKNLREGGADPAKPADKSVDVIQQFGKARAYDKETGFQTGHVAKIPAEEWRSHLDEAQVAELDRRFADRYEKVKGALAGL